MGDVQSPLDGQRWVRFVFRTSTAAALGLRVLASGEGTLAGTEAEPEIVAAWQGGVLRRVDHEAWRAFHELEAGPDAVREHAFVESMAARSLERGAQRATRTRLELESARQQVLLPLLRDHLADAVRVSDEEVETVAREQPEAFRRPRKLRLRSIYQRLDPDPRLAAATRARMEAIHRRLQDGASFAELARSESASQSRFRDGDLGLLSPEDLPPAVAAATRNLQPGQLTRPIEHGGGLSIFRCEDVREEHRPTVAEQREKIRATLVRHRRRESWARLRDDLLRAAGAIVDPDSAATPLTMAGYRLTAEEFVELVALRQPGQRIADLPPDKREQILRAWATGVLGVRRALALRLDTDPQAVAALRWRRLGVLARAELVRRVDERRREPDEAALRRWFRDHEARYQEPAATEVAAIHFGEDDPAQPQRAKLATDVLRRLESGELRFDEAARHYSTHRSAAGGGDMGWLSPHQIARWGAIASNALRQLAPGERSGLMHLESGLWIFEVRARREARPMSFQAAVGQIRRDLRHDQIRGLEADVRREQLSAIGLVLGPRRPIP